LDNLKTSLGQLNRYVRAARKGGGLEPNVIGPYVVGRPLVAGTLSWVYQARDTRTDEPVSIQIPFEDVLINPIYAACLQSELKLLGTIRHPGIIKIRERQGDALVLAPMAGMDFERYLQQHSQLSAARMAAYFQELLDITAYLHHQGIVHHDLRPANFILGEDGRLCLVDLGMAAHRDHPDPITASGMGPQGDARYMPPEQWAGMRGDPRSDIYTLGTLLYRMAAGRLPFEDSAKAYQFQAHKRGEILPPSSWQPHLSKAIEAVILKAMAAAPQDRYQWVEDFGDALAAVLPQD
jgi:serine/threonine protein kinase